MATTDNSKQRLIAIAAVVIVLLLGVNAFLLVNKAKQDSKNQELTSQLDEAGQLKAELEKQYYDALEELESMKGNNEDLNSLIDEQKAELEQQRNRIASLINSKADLDKARAEIKKLSTQVEQYVIEINQLKSENEQLTAQTQYLSSENDTLRTTLRTRQIENEELSTAKAALMSENETLSTEREVLAKKVNIASVIKVNNIGVTGYKIKGSGKESKKKYAKNVDNLEICFNTTANQVAEPGDEQFFIRIINPVGETMAVEGLGSGVITSSASGEQIRYTKSVDMDFNQKESNLCLSWTPNTAFQPGLYEVEIYNKGYLAGTGTFELK